MNDQYIKVLLVEDDLDQAELLRKMLTPSTQFAMTYVKRLGDAVIGIQRAAGLSPLDRSIWSGRRHSADRAG